MSVAGKPRCPRRWHHLGLCHKTFIRAELEPGINLADAFPTTPFAASFAVLERVIAVKQNRETQTIKGIITNFRTLQSEFADDQEVTAATDTLRRKLLERNAKDAVAARAAVKPVVHTILIVGKKGGVSVADKDIYLLTDTT
ncbi:MAG: hypothetical protein HQ492_04065 [Woeseiaceae bacterium]|nr:hypothetical protein [Woeseiaceae bacterium]